MALPVLFLVSQLPEEVSEDITCNLRGEKKACFDLKYVSHC